jgi:hypothetical protein
MTESYGHKWVSAMGAEPNDTWTDSLRGLSMEEWIRAITKLKESTDDWPPGLPEFKRWAVGSLSEAEIKNLAIEEWNNRPPPKYNPFVTPPTYEEEERNRRNFIQSRIAEAAYESRGGHKALSFTEPNVDPRRICQDEELN